MAILLASLLLAAPLLTANASAIREGPPPILDPKRYSSASARFVLEVDPSHRHGSGPARYRMLRDGEEVWSGEKPFTLWQAVVADDGTTVGYGYPEGQESAHRSRFLFAILDPAGEVRARQDSEARSSMMVCPVPDPVHGLCVDCGGDRAVLRLMRGDVLSGEIWRSFRISTGEVLAEVDPTRSLPQLPEYVSLRGAAAVPGTGLALAQWWRPSADSAFFALLDAEAKPVWTLDLGRDYARVSEETARWRMQDWVRDGNAIAVDADASRFEIRSVAEQSRLRFEATPDEATKTGWSVRELGRERLDLSFGPPAEPELPAIRLEKLGEVTFASGAPALVSPIRNVLTFDFDSQGRFEFVRREPEPESGLTWCLVDGEGRLVRETRLPSLGAEEEVRLHWLRISDERWLATASGFGVGASAKAWWIDTRGGAIDAIEGFECPPVESLASDRGGFVALSERREEYGSTPFLVAFDAHGRRRWSVQGMGNVVTKDPAKLLAPSSVAVIDDGTVVVTDSIRRTIQLFDEDGRFERSISLADAPGAKYPSHLLASGPSEVLVYDSGGNANTLWRMSLDGKVLGSFAPRHADGHDPAPYGGRVRIAPDGRLWTSDGQMLLRLGADGVVDRVAGNVPDAEAPAAFEDPFVDSLGRILALDRRARAVQVFDGDGRRLGVGRLEADETLVQSSASSFADPGDGSVLVRLQSREHVRFDEQGTRLGRMRLEDESQPHRIVLRPGTRERWLVVGWQGETLVHVPENGDAKARRTIRRRPDGRWLRSTGATRIGADGALVALDGSSMDPSEIPEALCVYPTDGAAGRVVELPGREFERELAVLRDWFAIASRDSMLFVDRAKGTIVRAELVPPAADDCAKVRTFASPDGRELWLVDPARRKLFRYAVP